MNESRSINTKRNIIAGLLYNLQSIFFNFIIRTALLFILGDQYLGLSSLFTSILSVLNLAELGFSSAIVVNMYKPLAEKNEQAVCALINYYKKIYQFIGLMILGIGLMIIPWIPKLINGSWPNNINIYLLYVFYLIETSLSYYLFAYKTSILEASQRTDLAKIIYSIINIIKSILQIFLLWVFKNYYLFVLTSLIFTILRNFSVFYITSKKFPKFTACGVLDDNIKFTIKRQVSGLMISKIGGVSRNSFDSIIISIFSGLTDVAIYNNYYFIYYGIYAASNMITQAMQASVGNSIATENANKNLNDMNKFQFIFTWIIVICTACLICLYQPFMKIWVGEKRLLNNFQMVLFSLYFYIMSMTGIRNLYFQGNGLWWNAKKASILEAIGNLILNILLGYFYGISGVLIATIVTIFIFNYIMKTNILFKQYFRISPWCFYKDIIFYTFAAVFVCIICYKVCFFISFGGILSLLIKFIIVLLVSNFVWYLIFFNKTIYRESKEFIRTVLHLS